MLKLTKQQEHEKDKKECEATEQEEAEFEQMMIEDTKKRLEAIDQKITAAIAAGDWPLIDDLQLKHLELSVELSELGEE